VIIISLPRTTIPAHASRVRVCVDSHCNGKVSRVYAAKAPGLLLCAMIIGTYNGAIGDGVTLEHGLMLDWPEDERPNVPIGFPLQAEFSNTTPTAIVLQGFAFVVHQPVERYDFR